MISSEKKRGRKCTRDLVRKKKKRGLRKKVYIGSRQKRKKEKRKKKKKKKGGGGGRLGWRRGYSDIQSCVPLIPSIHTNLFDQSASEGNRIKPLFQSADEGNCDCMKCRCGRGPSPVHSGQARFASEQKGTSMSKHVAPVRSCGSFIRV